MSADIRRATGCSLLLHALPVALALLELWWTGHARPGKGGASIETNLADVTALSPALQRVMKQPQTHPQAQQMPEISPPSSQTQPAPDREEVLMKPDAVTQKEVAPTDLEHQPVTPPSPHSVIEEAPSAEVAENADGPSGSSSSDADLLAQYHAALQEAIARNWTRPKWVHPEERCKLIISQMQGGGVIEVQVDPSCPFDELARRSLEAAVLQAQPLPYAGFESVFQQSLVFEFEASE